MALTKIADVVVPEIYDAYGMERSIYHSALYKSGIIVADPKIKANLEGGAKQFVTPFWQDIIDLDNLDEVPSETNDVNTDKVTASEFNVRRQFRVKKWGSSNMASVLSGVNPIDAILSMIENFWNTAMQVNLFSQIQGVIADNIANDGGDLVYDVTGIGDGKISSEAIIDTNFLMGDKFDEISTIAMHSKPYSTLVKNNLIDFEADSEQNVGFGTYLGKTVILDDHATKVTEGDSTVYWNIMFKNGAFGYGESYSGYLPTEVDRNADRSGGEDYLHTRRVFALHPAGFNWVESSITGGDGKFPSNADLKNGANWDRAFSSAKNVGFLVCKTLG